MKRKTPRKHKNPRIYERLAEANPQALTADGFEDAFIGILYRFSNDGLACYDRDKCIDVLMKRDGMSLDDAEEFFSFNTIGAWVGEGTPCFLERCEPDLRKTRKTP